jgi:catechol 2,3-dioxygenase-like lactoylglutathione lyase family enzyme
MRIDHVIYAAADLDAAVSWIEDVLGLAAVGGGRHEGHGTRNRIVPLGGGYLELLSVADPEEAATSEFGRGLQTRLARDGDGWLAWVVAVDDVDPIARRLGTTITTLRREGLSARLTGVEQAMREPLLPFFVSRDAGVADPGATGDAGGITWVELAGDSARLERWLESTPLPVRVLEGPAALRAVGIGDRALRV